MEDTATTLETALQVVASRAPSHDTPNGGKIVIVPVGYRAERISPRSPLGAALSLRQ